MAATNKEKFVKCLQCKQIKESQNSICCDKCNNWIHLRCSKVGKSFFKSLVDTPTTKFYCDFCKNFSCGKCDKPVFNDQNAVQCDSICNKWFHIKCVNINKITNKDLKKSIEPWFCNGCYSPPFTN